MTDKYLKIMGSIALLAAAGAAHSQTITFPTTNTSPTFGSDIVLFVSDTTDSEYFTIDTGISLDSVKSQASIVADGVQQTAIGSIAAPTFSSAVDAALTSYLNSDTHAGDTITWTLAGADSNSQNSGKSAQLGAFRYLISSATPLDGSAPGISRMTNSDVKNSTGVSDNTGLQGFFAEVNAAGIPANGVSTTEGWGAGPLGVNQPTANTTYGTPVTLTAINSGVASSLQLFLFATNSTQGTPANMYETAANALTLNWTRGGDATITAAGGTTPVPLPAAVWLFGSGLLGLFGIGRRKQQPA